MKLVNLKYFDVIPINESEPETLVIENCQLLRNLMEDLVYQIETDEGDFVLSDERNKPLLLSKSLMLMTDIFHLDTTGKSLKTKLNNLIISEYSDIEGREQLMERLNNLGITICNECPYPLSFKSNLTFTDVVKLLDFTLDISEGTFWERLMEYISVSFELLGFKSLVTLNLKDFISKEEYDELIKSFSYKNIPVLMIESRQHKDLDSNSHIHIIDNDLCVL